MMLRVARFLGGLAWLFPGARRGAAQLQELERWVLEASEQQLFDALADERLDVRGLAVRELCARDPGRSVEPIVTAFRRREGRAEHPYQPPDTAEILRLGLGFCDCKELGPMERFTSVLADRQQDVTLRVLAANVLMGVDDPAAEQALRAATRDPDRGVRMAAKQGLDLRDTALQDKRAWAQRTRRAEAGHPAEGP